jgi:hypothetical protein
MQKDFFEVIISIIITSLGIPIVISISNITLPVICNSEQPGLYLWLFLSRLILIANQIGYLSWDIQKALFEAILSIIITSLRIPIDISISNFQFIGIL